VVAHVLGQSACRERLAALHLGVELVVNLRLVVVELSEVIGSSAI
jgi:hypothetical protein